MFGEPQCPRALLKARALLDAAHAIDYVRANDGDGDRHTQQRRARGATQRRLVAAAPTYLKQRVAHGHQLPQVQVHGSDEQLVACVKYALGLEGGVGVVLEG